MTQNVVGTVSHEQRRMLATALGLDEGQSAFPWQEALLAQFLRGVIPAALDVPTGLGKTAVIAIWLLARAFGADVPRRVAYAVDRRAVVDQATDVAEELREWLETMPALKTSLGLGDRKLPVSTLRGKLADNREWLDDPSAPAIIIGTVDMIGSRLLFEGYGISPKMRAYHAGFIGNDTLVALDEAHLVPPFEKLVQTIATDTAALGPADNALRALLPPFRTISLSATGQTAATSTHTLATEDLSHEIVAKRLRSRKQLLISENDSDAEAKAGELLASRAFALSQNGTLPVRILVFCDSRRVAEDACSALKKLAMREKKAESNAGVIDCDLFVGGRRVFEREAAAKKLGSWGFIAGTKVKRTTPAFIFATAAGEVGVDLDADHMIGDIVEWERMVQRVGRVNRRGERDAIIEIVPIPTQDAQRAVRFSRVRELLHRLPTTGKFIDASPGALRELRDESGRDEELAKQIEEASTPAPLWPALMRAHLDAWAMTSLRNHTGRTEVAPWIRGWIEEDPQCSVVWRRYLPLRVTTAGVVPLTLKETTEFFEAAPPHLQELLEADVDRVFEWLLARTATFLKVTNIQAEYVSPDPELPPLERDSLIGFIRSSDGEIVRSLKLDQFAADGPVKTEKGWSDRLKAALRDATLIIDARLGGLDTGLLSSKTEQPIPVPTADGTDHSMNTSDVSDPPRIPFKVTLRKAGKERALAAGWNARLSVPYELDAKGDPTSFLDIDKWKMSAETEDDRSESFPQKLDDHQAETATHAGAIADALRLPAEYREMLVVAASLHDEGKRARIWQRAFSAPSDPDGRPYAKTAGPVRPKLLDGYRHELGSIPLAETATSLKKLSEEHRELALHLIVAHHGFGRPYIRTDGCEDAPPSLLEARAREIALRFIRLQQRWGPWGLAWWESLLRAADQRASRANDQRGADAKAGKARR